MAALAVSQGANLIPEQKNCDLMCQAKLAAYAPNGITCTTGTYCSAAVNKITSTIVSHRCVPIREPILLSSLLPRDTRVTHISRSFSCTVASLSAQARRFPVRSRVGQPTARSLALAEEAVACVHVDGVMRART